MTQFLNVVSLSRAQKIDFSILVAISLLITIMVLFLSLLIPVIADSHKIYLPTTVDYFRTFILAFLISLILNYSSRFISKFTILFKVWIQFLGILLLAYPQKIDALKTFSSWNLIKREAYLFGAFYQIGSLLFYLYDQLILLNDGENKRLSSDDDDEINQIIESARQKSTLENCIQVRRNSSNLRKVLYTQNYKYHDYKTSNTPDPQEDQIEDYPSFTNFSESNLLETSNLINITTTGDSKIHPSRSYGSIVSSSFSLKQPSMIAPRVQWVVDHTIWIISSFLYEIGIASILGITFIYVPGINGHFSRLEIYFYNHIDLFVLEVITPLFIVTTGVQYVIYRAYVTFKDDKSHIKDIVLAYWIYVTISVLLFGFSFVL